MAEGRTIVRFSLDSDFDELTDKDTTVELVGYVCSVSGPQDVGVNRKYQLLKFSLSNAHSKRIQCVVWGSALIEQYLRLFTMNRIVHISGAHCKSTKLSFALKSQGFVPFELIIQSNTLVENVGIFNAAFDPQEPLFM